MPVDVIIISASIVLFIVGICGCILPVLPGLPLVWSGLLLSYFSSFTNISLIAVIITGVVTLFICIADNVFPALLTKKSGGSKEGIIGSVIGMILGFFAGPVGIIVGPFLGALVGEVVHDPSNKERIFEAAFGTFKGFMLGLGIKLVASFIFVWIFILSITVN